LLRELRHAPADVRNRLVLLMLDTDIERRYQAQIRKMELQPFTIIEAYDLAGTFRVHRAPFIYVCDGEGTILDAFAILTLSEVVALGRTHFGSATGKETVAYERRPAPYQSIGQPGQSPDNAVVAEVHAP